MPRNRNILCITLTSLAMTAAASADTVQVQDLGVSGNPGRAAPVTLSGGLTFADGSTSQQVWAGTRTLLVDGAQIHAYTLELTGVSGGGQFEQVSARETLGELRTEALNALFAANNQGDLNHREKTVAFQAVVWEIMYDFDGTPESIDYSAGNVQVGMVRASLFELMKLNAIRAGSPDSLDVIGGDYVNNDYLRVVPLPSTAALAGLGLAGVGFRRRR